MKLMGRPFCPSVMLSPKATKFVTASSLCRSVTENEQVARRAIASTAVQATGVSPI
jgi:hypothetical protein